MDIHKWLEETAEADAPRDPAQTLGATFPQRPEKSKPVFKDKRAAKRTRSDSSLLEPQPPTQRENSPAKRSKLSTEEKPVPGAHSEDSHPSQSDSAESESSSHRYARKPRRKTRLERYEPKPVEQRVKHVHPSRKGESKKTRRKSKRRKGEHSGSGIADGFHAKNVSGNRLTLKPRDQLGIFNKGKTSSAVRGRGLPDLVFSEMKFLQREKEQPEPVIEHVAKKKRKKDHAHTREGEISAFFSSVRPALTEKDGNAAGVVSRSERERSTKSSGVVPTVEVPDKGPYLGFGSRGPRHESTSYVSWSDSVRGPAVTPRHPKQVHAAEKDDHDTTKHQSASTTTGEENSGSKRPAPRAVEHSTHDRSGQFRVSSVIASVSHQRASRSYSLPQHTSSPQRMNLVDRAAKIYMTDNIQSPSSMPQSVPVHTNYHYRPTAETRPAFTTRPNQACTQGTPMRRRTVPDQQNDATDVEPQLSSDLEAVIEQCNATFDERRRMSGQRRRHTVLPEQHFEHDAMESADMRRSNVERRVRFTGLERPPPVLPNFSGPSIYEQQAQRQAVPLLPSRHEDEGVSYSRSGLADFDDGHDLLSSEAYWEEYPEAQASYTDNLDTMDYGMEDGTAAGHQVQRLASDNSVVASGFWRPNRLY